MITIGGKTWNSLDNIIKVGGKTIVAVYCGNKKVYPNKQEKERPGDGEADSQGRYLAWLLLYDGGWSTGDHFVLAYYAVGLFVPNEESVDVTLLCTYDIGGNKVTDPNTYIFNGTEKTNKFIVEYETDISFLWISAPLTGFPHKSYETAIASIRSYMIMRRVKFNTTIDFDFFYDGAVSGKKMVNLAIEYLGSGKGKGNTGDYLFFGYKKWGSTITQDINYDFVFGWTFTYYTTYEQETASIAVANNALDSIISSGMTEYQKIRAVSDWIRSYSTPDMDEYQSSTIIHPLAYVMYGAVVDRLATGEGYHVTLYYMLTEAGVYVRLITGKVNNVVRTWAIVKIGSYWYNLDIWIDDVEGGYSHFLKSNADFPDYVRDSAYNTNDWNAAHPMAASSYIPPN